MSPPPIPGRVSVLLDDAGVGAPIEVGRLSREAGSGAEVIRFEYSSEWLEGTARAFPLDPELPLYPGDFYSSLRSGLFGIFRDTSPDRWGRVLMERREGLEARNERRKPRRLGEWGFLLGVSDVTRVGALRLREEGGAGLFLDGRALGAPPATRLRELQAAALALEEPDTEERPEYEAWLRLLLAPGTSLGGARPKATFTASDGSLWIAKFPGRQDRHDVGAWALLTHRLAERAKIRVPRAELMHLGGNHHTFALERFDREGERRLLYASAMTLLVRNDGDTASYLDLAQAIQDHGDPESIGPDLAELYRRALFNVLVGNRDDHLRNHGFLRARRGWRLAPAFDVNPNPDRDEHALTLDGESSLPSVSALRATRELYRLSKDASARIEREVREAVLEWRTTAESSGIARRELERLATVIDPELD